VSAVAPGFASMADTALVATTAAGFFGKVSSHGDFVARRLPPPLVARWDAWLQACLQASRAQLGAAWLPTYLTSPVWRFALGPGVAGDEAWAGVLMPSVDRVGRHFPLMMGAGSAGPVCLLDWLEQGAPWYDALEALALSSLQSGFLLADFDAALPTRLPTSLPTSLPASSHGAGSDMALAGAPRWHFHFASPGLDHMTAQMPALTRQIAHGLLSGHSLWWSDGSSEVAPSLVLCHGMPDPASFTAMIDGNWRQHGWQCVDTPLVR
jgi:type VI secretion system protein ImpM